MANEKDIVGTWNMNHDGWVGTLTIFPYDQIQNEIDGNCSYRYVVIGGRYIGSDGKAFEVRGTVGGEDPLAPGPCPQQQDKVRFTVAFPGPPPQRFEGYLFNQRPRYMAGYTWWNNIPFGWFAEKQLNPVALRISAYLHWCGRGRPLGDDWTDWFYAERLARGEAD